MGIFIKLNNINRFPGLVLRVKGTGDEIEIDYESCEEVSRTTSNDTADARASEASVSPVVDR